MSPFTKAAILIIGTASVAVAAPVAHGGRKFVVEMTGAAEIAGGALTADLDASGTALIYVNVGQRRVCWDFENLTNIDAGSTFIAAHIHRGAIDRTGLPVIHFFNPPTTNRLEGCTPSNQNRALLTEVLQNPERFYVNLHSNFYPGGAIRGQMSK